MLDLMRKHARSWIMKVLLGLIIVVFVFYFGSVGREQEARTLAVLKGKSLVYLNFQKEYADLVEFYRRQFGPALTEELLRELKVKQQAFDNMIYKALALQKAEEWKITITGEELRQSIINNPAFQRNGVFDPRLYEQTLRLNRMTNEDFEQTQKDLLTISRLEAILASAAAVTEREVREMESLQNEEVALEAILISPGEWQKKVQPTREELEKFHKEQGGLFRKPEQYQLAYISFPVEEYEDKVKISEAEIDAALTRANAALKEGRQDPKGKNAPAGISREQVIREIKRQKKMQAAQEAARKAYEIIYQEEDLEKYARENHRSIKKTEFFPLSQPPADLSGIFDLAKITTAAQKGEITGVVGNDKGFYITKLLDKKAAAIPPFAEVEKEVEKKYIENQAVVLSRAAAEDILAELKKGTPWPSLAKKEGMKTVDTGFFRPGGPVPVLGQVTREINDALFTLTPKNPYPERTFVLSDGRFLLFRLKERRVLEAGNFAATKDMLLRQLRQMKKQELVRSFIEDYKKLLIEKGDLKIVKEVKDI